MIATVTRPDQSKPLQHGGYRNAAFDLLISTSATRSLIVQWQRTFMDLNDWRVRANERHEQHLRLLDPEAGSPPWTRFFQDLLACALHLVNGSEARSKATSALWEADKLSEAMVDWALLVAIALEVQD